MCGLLFDDYVPMSRRNDAQHCPGCQGPSGRDVEAELASTSNIDETTKEHTRYSQSMGVNPEQIPAAMKAYPGSEYTPDGRLIIRSRQHKLKEMRRRNMEEL